MSHYYHSYEEEDAYRNGRRDGNYGRFDHTYDCHFGDDVDRAYCEGYHEVEEERREERRREEEEMERQMLQEEQWRRERQWEEQQEYYRQCYEEDRRQEYEEQMRREYEEYLHQAPIEIPPPESEEDSFTPDYNPF
jgi:hypothetical protein